MSKIAVVDKWHIRNCETVFEGMRRKFFLIILFLIFTLLPVSVPVLAQEDYGLNAAANKAGLFRSDSTPQIVGKLLGAALSLVGVLFFILMVYAGITWMLARGNEEQAKKALNTIVAAVIGMIITISSYAITNFVLNSASSGSLGIGAGLQQDNGDGTVEETACADLGGVCGATCGSLGTENTAGVCTDSTKSKCCVRAEAGGGGTACPESRTASQIVACGPLNECVSVPELQQTARQLSDKICTTEGDVCCESTIERATLGGACVGDDTTARDAFCATIQPIGEYLCQESDKTCIDLCTEDGRSCMPASQCQTLSIQDDKCPGTGTKCCLLATESGEGSGNTGCHCLTPAGGSICLNTVVDSGTSPRVACVQTCTAGGHTFVLEEFVGTVCP